MKKSNIYYAFFVLLTIMLSCTPEDSITPSDDINFEYGKEKVYDLNSGINSNITEELTGWRIIFPKGANGSLIIKEILKFPELTIQPEKVFNLNYAGSDSILIEIPLEKDNFGFLCYFGKAKYGSLSRMKNVDKWHSLSDYQRTDTSIIFALYNSINSTTKRIYDETQAIKSTNFAFVNIQPNSTNAQVIQFVRQSIDQMYSYVRDLLNSDFKQTYVGLYNSLGIQLNYVSDSEGSSFSLGSKPWFGKRDAIFEFTLEPGMNTPIISHEAGHMINALLYGINDFDRLWARFGNLEHVAFTPMTNGREQGLQEDIAYLLETILTSNPAISDITFESPAVWNVMPNNGNNGNLIMNPAYVDFPSIEGLGAALMRQLTAKNPKLYTFECTNQSGKDQRKLLQTVPVLGISEADLINNILLRKPMTINDAFQHITEYLAEQSSDLLPKFLVRAEAIGWSYNAKTIIKDKDGNPLQNVKILPVMQTGNSTRDYSTWESFLSDAKGECVIPRIYPGTCILRVFYNSGKDSLDVPYSVDYRLPTNQTLIIPTIIIDDKKDETNTKTLSFTTNEEWGNGVAKFKIEVNYELTGYGVELYSENPDNFAVLTGKLSTIKANGKVTIDQLKQKVGDDKDYVEYSFGTPKVVFRSSSNSSYDMTSETRNSNPYTGTFYAVEGKNIIIEAAVNIPVTSKRYENGVMSYKFDDILSREGKQCWIRARK